MATAQQHPLKDTWKLNFLPQITKEIVNKSYEGDWAKAQKALLKAVDDVTTIEELWSTVNSIPKLHQLNQSDNVIFARNSVDPSFESFPNGHRIQITTTTSTAADKMFDLILISVVGEGCTTVCEGESTADVIRAAHKPSFQHKDSVRLEIWLRSGKYAKELMSHFSKMLKEHNVHAEIKEEKLK